jgi:hypothetical protein
MNDKKHEALHKCFMGVANKKDWKMPINALIQKKDVKMVEEAINFFAGGGVEFKKDKKGFLRVTAPGYYGNGF